VAKQQRRFVSDAAHELRTPLAALRILLDEALLYPDEVDPLAALGEALREANRLEAIVADLLFLAYLNTGANIPSEVVDLTELVTVEITHRSPALRFTRPDQTIMVRGAREQLSRLIGNLLDNAEKHARGHVEVRLWQDAGHALLSVTDDGPGIPPNERERIYEPFARLHSARDRDTGGTGLGLTIAHGIAVAHNGELMIEDSLPGTRLVLRLALLSTRATA
jgi:signal transduction histidine kinase